MNVARMRLVDRWLGVPVCFLLSMWRRLFGRRAPATSVPPRRLLFVKLAEQGSTVLAQAALQTAIDKVGAANVFFLLFAEIGSVQGRNVSAYRLPDSRCFELAMR